MKRSGYPLILFLPLVFFFFHCNPVKKIGENNLAHLYNKDKHPYHPEFTLFQFAEDSTKLYFSVNTQELLYKTLANSELKVASFSIKFMLFEEWDSKIVTDSSTILLNDTVINDPSGYISGFINIYSPLPESKVLSVVMKDILRNNAVEQIFYLSGKSVTGRYYYNLLDDNGNILYNNHLVTGKSFRLNAAFEMEKGMWVKHYSKEFPVAYPPFSVLNAQKHQLSSDSTFFLPFTNRKTSLLSFTKPGIYFFQNDTNTREGFPVFIHPYSFPEIRSPKQMTRPLQYLTTGNEFKQIISHPDEKAVVDSFWLEHAGEPDRAQTLIRDYYKRIEEANRLFSSYVAGWKTDRGMIYVIFGPPDLVYRDENTEVWQYGETGSMLSINMIFHKIENPFCTNDYILERSTAYKSAWIQRVNRWRR